MPRRPSIKLAGMPQHVVQRGVNREPWFLPKGLPEVKSKEGSTLFI